MFDVVEERGEVHVDHVVLAPSQGLSDSVDGVVCSSSWARAHGAVREVGFKDWLQKETDRALYEGSQYQWNRKLSLLTRRAVRVGSQLHRQAEALGRPEDRPCASFALLGGRRLP
jgi:hypothetical protein